MWRGGDISSTGAIVSLIQFINFWIHFFYFTKNFFVAKSHPLHVCGVGRRVWKEKVWPNKKIFNNSKTQKNGNTHARFKRHKMGGDCTVEKFQLKKSRGSFLCVWKNKRRIKTIGSWTQKKSQTLPFSCMHTLTTNWAGK